MAPVISSGAAEDGAFFQDAMAEVEGEFEEPVTIKRWTAGPSSPTSTDPIYLGANDWSGADTFASINTTANITELDQTMMAFANVLYQTGDLLAEFRIPVYGGESNVGDANPLVIGSQPGARNADRVIYRGRTYMVVGHVARPFETRTQYYKCVLRQLDK